MLYERKTLKHNRTTMTGYCYKFDSLPELYRWLDSTPRTWRGNESRNERPAMDWDLRAGFDGAMNFAKVGWVDGAQRIAKAMKAFKAPPRAPFDKLAVAGYRPSVPAYLAGSPRSMFAQADEGGPKRPVLRLYVQVGAVCTVDAEHMANIGAAVAQYVKQREAEGTRCEVYGASSATSGRNNVTFAWLVKRADQPLDLPMLAFSIGHPAMHRRIVFALRERSACPEMFGYGRTGAIDAQNFIRPHKEAVYINGMMQADSVARTPQAALDWLARQVEAK